MLNTSVLVLNRSYFPVNVTTLKRAFCMLCQGIAKVLDEQYRQFDFSSWAELSAEVESERVGMVGRCIRVPRVIVLTAFDRMPQRGIKFSRINIMLRDKYTCQYCGKRFSRNKLNLDHITPRSRGGKTTWDNVVSSCLPCNRKKGWKTPEEAGMHLIRKPFRPNTLPFLDLSFFRTHHHDSWKPFLSVVDFSYWHVELEE